ncbi:MAG: hypothetical protein QXV51_01735 [Thermosphaera sp.]
MITPKGISVKLLNKILEELNQRGIYAERHSYSIRMMFKGRFVASLHLYPGFNQGVLRVYGDSEEINQFIVNVVGELLNKYLKELELIVERKHLVY